MKNNLVVPVKEVTAHPGMVRGGMTSGSTSGLLLLVLVVFALSALALSAPSNAADYKSDVGHSTTEHSESFQPLNFDTASKLLASRRFTAPGGWQWSHFENADAAKIRYGYAKSQVAKKKGTIILLPGFTEFAEVYFETARDFLAKGYDVYALDWRGAGGSDRVLPDRERASTLGFDHDVADLDQFITAVVKKQSSSPIVLVAHSIGSHLALRYLHEHPGLVDRAVLSAPGLDCPGTDMPPWTVSLYSWLMWKSGRGNAYVDKQGNWQDMAPRVSKLFTHSHDPVRVKLEEAWCAVNPELRSGGATWKWLWLFQESCDLLNGSGYASSIKTPTLIGCALSDKIANPRQDAEFAKHMSAGRAYEGQDTRHDMFLEDDEHRAPWMKAIFDFLNERNN